MNFIKSKFLLILTCLLLIQCAGDNDMNEYYSDGSIKKKVILDSPKKACFYHYYENGNLKKKACQINNKIEGKYYEYYENGSLYCELNFINDIKQGKATYYHKNGVSSDIIHFENGIQVGYRESYTDFGKLWLLNFKENGETYYIKEIYYDNEKKIREQESYFPKVEMVSDSIMEKGDTLIFKAQLPIPDSLVGSKKLVFLYDISAYCDQDSLVRDPTIIKTIPTNKYRYYGLIPEVVDSCMILYGLIGTDINNHSVYLHEPWFKKKFSVLPKKKDSTNL